MKIWFCILWEESAYWKIAIARIVYACGQGVKWQVFGQYAGSGKQIENG